MPIDAMAAVGRRGYAHLSGMEHRALGGVISWMPVQRPLRREARRVGRLAGWLLVLIPLAVLQTLPAALLHETTTAWALWDLLPQPSWDFPRTTNCYGLPVGTAADRLLWLATRTTQCLTLLHGVLIPLSTLTAAFVAVAARGLRRREALFLTATMCTTLVSAWALGAGLIIVLRYMPVE
jgi:hypothetical protein